MTFHPRSERHKHAGEQVKIRFRKCRKTRDWILVHDLGTGDCYVAHNDKTHQWSVPPVVKEYWFKYGWKCRDGKEFRRNWFGVSMMDFMWHPTYKHLQSTLQYNDVVEFGDLKYKVQGHYLLNTSWADDYVIFNRLEVDANNFCSASYGYPANSGDRPTCKEQDYEALSRCVDDIIDFIFTNHITWL